MLYLPPHFRETDVAALHAQIRDAADREAVASALSASDDPRSRDVGILMRAAKQD